MRTRAKFVVTKVARVSETCERISFMAVTSKPFDADGNSEDNDFARWTPSGSITMDITNPALLGMFKEGQKYYTDFTETVD